MTPISKLSLEEKRNILSSLEDVGRTKAIGYLPLNTIEKVLGEDIDDISPEMRAQGLSTIRFGAKDTCIKSGALFVFMPSMVSQIIAEHNIRSPKNNYNAPPDAVILLLASRWYAANDPIMPLIKSLYGEK